MIDEAIVICTRNRSDDLHTLLTNLGTQNGMDGRRVVVMDASEEEAARQNKIYCSSVDGLHVSYHRFEGAPSLARQRNQAVEAMPDDIRIVHFLDDDVTLAPDCLDRLSAAFADDKVGGVGGHVMEEGFKRRMPTFWRRLFLLDAGKPGLVLPSGASTLAQLVPSEHPFETEWLGGAASYRRAILIQERFDDRLEGYSLDEDVDFSYRVSRNHRLKVIPDAVLHHHVSADGRLDRRRYAHDFLVHRYWFLEKNVSHVLRKPAFWWSTCGRLMATVLSGEASKRETVAGLLDGVQTIWRRDHPLLNRP